MPPANRGGHYRIALRLRPDGAPARRPFDQPLSAGVVTGVVNANANDYHLIMRKRTAPLHRQSALPRQGATHARVQAPSTSTHRPAPAPDLPAWLDAPGRAVILAAVLSMAGLYLLLFAFAPAA